MNIVLELIDKYWKFDDNQQPMSSWHDKQDLLKAIEHEFQLNKTCSKCVSLCKNTKSKYKHDKYVAGNAEMEQDFDIIMQKYQSEQ